MTCECAAGLIAKAKQVGDPCSDLAADFLQELLEVPLTGQSVFSAAASELKGAVAALSDHGRYVSLTGHWQGALAALPDHNEMRIIHQPFTMQWLVTARSMEGRVEQVTLSIHVRLLMSLRLFLQSEAKSYWRT